MENAFTPNGADIPIFGDYGFSLENQDWHLPAVATPHNARVVPVSRKINGIYNQTRLEFLTLTSPWTDSQTLKAAMQVSGS